MSLLCVFCFHQKLLTNIFETVRADFLLLKSRSIINAKLIGALFFLKKKKKCSSDIFFVCFNGFNQHIFITNKLQRGKHHT